jgi:hypothetical protein
VETMMPTGNEILNKLHEKFGDAVKQMIIERQRAEGWTKGTMRTAYDLYKELCL